MKRGVGPAPEVRRVEDALRRRLGTDVRVSLRAKGKGQITWRSTPTRISPACSNSCWARRSTDEPAHVTIVVHTDGDLNSRQYRISLRLLQVGKAVAIAVAIIAVGFLRSPGRSCATPRASRGCSAKSRACARKTAACKSWRPR